MLGKKMPSAPITQAEEPCHLLLNHCVPFFLYALAVANVSAAPLIEGS